MIKIINAPAGFIGQIHSDTPTNDWLNVTGYWCTTEQEAIVSVKREYKKEMKKLQKKIKELTKKMNDLRSSVPEDFND